MPVRSHKNRMVVEAARLHRAGERRDQGQTLIEGPHLLDEALSAGVKPSLVFALEGDVPTADLSTLHAFDLILVDELGLTRVAGTKSPRGPVAVIEIPSQPSLGSKNVLVAWGVGDPGNVGTMIRTAAGFGWSFAYTKGTADPWAPKVLRAGAGAHFRTGAVALDSLEELHQLGYRTLSTVVAGGEDPIAVGSGPLAVLIGDESSGLPPSVVADSSQRITLPMPGGIESLNAATAAAIFVYELSKGASPR
ncbi:MAG TPA: RNA methyltransferase [Acidimicrobiia bacterium]